eukprot:5261385-Amphidinium_carterae.1
MLQLICGQLARGQSHPSCPVVALSLKTAAGGREPYSLEMASVVDHRALAVLDYSVSIGNALWFPSWTRLLWRRW